MESKQTASVQLKHIMPGRKFSKYVLILFILFLLIAVAEGAYYFYLQKSKTSEESQEGQFDTSEAGLIERANVPPEGPAPSYQDLIEKYPPSAREGVYYGDSESFNLLGKVIEIDTIEKKIMVQVYDDVLTIYYNDSSQRMTEGKRIVFGKFLPEEIREEEQISFVVSRDQNGKFILKFQTQ